MIKVSVQRHFLSCSCVWCLLCCMNGGGFQCQGRNNDPGVQLLRTCDFTTHKTDPGTNQQLFHRQQEKCPINFTLEFPVMEREGEREIKYSIAISKDHAASQEPIVFNTCLCMQDACLFTIILSGI